MQDLYKIAVQRRFTFPTAAGECSVSDLFQLPLTSASGRANLNDVARELYAQIQSAAVVDFVGEAADPENSTAGIKLEIVKDVIATIKAQREAATKAAEASNAKRRILELINKKQDEALSEKSVEELQALLANLS